MYAGFNDSRRIPIGYGFEIENEDGVMTTFTTHLDAANEKPIILAKFYLTDSALFGNAYVENKNDIADGAYIIFYLKEKKLVSITDTNEYITFAKKNRIPELDSFKDFNYYYWQFRNGKSFWQKYLVP